MSLLIITPENPYLPAQIQNRIVTARYGSCMYFYGYLSGMFVCEISSTIAPDDKYTQNGKYFLDKSTAYRFNFETRECYINMGYFSALYKYAESSLNKIGFSRLVLGVEPDNMPNRSSCEKSDIAIRFTKGMRNSKVCELMYSISRKTYRVP